MLHNGSVLVAWLLAVWVATDARADVTQFVRQHCLNCHGDMKPKGNVSLKGLSPNPAKRSEIDLWKSVLDQLESGAMPPDGSRQPSAEARLNAVNDIKSVLRSTGESFDESRWLAPVRGNALDHDLLFSGKATDPAATRPRLWRVTGQAYEQYMQYLNVKYALGLKSYGTQKLRAPWELKPGKEFSDYAFAHRVGDADIEYHLRNVSQVANLMVQRFAKQKPTAGSGGILEVHLLLKAGTDATPEQMRKAVEACFEKLLQRKPEPEELTRYTNFLASNIKSLDVERGTEQFLIALLLRPEVLYRLELPSSGGERSLMPPQMLARAISFSIADEEPDAALHKAVQEGRLATREEAREHVQRLLATPTKSQSRVLRFFQEYFGYSTANDVFKDDATLGEHGLKRQTHAPDVYVADTDRLVEWVLDRDEQVLRELLTTNKTFVLFAGPKSKSSIKNYAETLRAGKIPSRDAKSGDKRTDGFGYPGTPTPDAILKLYEIKLHVRDYTDEKPYDMPADHRVGILTHPSWLIAHSTNFDNHAIDRGRWIRERLLGGRVPDIPITVDATLPDEPHVTLRERMRVTRVEYCWQCHQYMDPLGLVFEQYDHLGRFRTAELVVDKEATAARERKGGSRVMKTVPFDMTGFVHKSGDPKLDGPVSNPRELIEKLAHSERVEQVFVRHAFRYFLGRNETLSDGPALVAAHQAYKQNNGSMKALLLSLLTSDPFLYRSLK